ncbi:MAG: DUF4349 domain-containing protein [Lachnospiraceae bacterium]|nr:DUF4349 domain-containing protein [Lachnospiraceae bacterium]
MNKCKTKWAWAAALAGAVIASVFLLAGCGAGSKSSDTMAAAATTAAAFETAAPADAVWDSDEMEAGEWIADEAVSGNDDLSSASGALALAATNRKLIRTIRMDVETEEFDTLLQAVSAKISALGGYTEQSEVSGNRTNYYGEPVPRYASVTARIPSGNLDAFVTEVETNGNVTSKSETTEDVTLRYSDIESRKKSLEIEQERIWALLEKADTLEAVISLEERLSEIRYELESMGSQLRLFDNQVEYSTVWLSISEVTFRLTPTAPLTASQRMQNGFQDNMNRLGIFFTNFIIGIFISSPFWIPIVIICFIVWFFLRRRAKQADGTNPKRSRFPFSRKDGNDSKGDSNSKN